MRMCICIGTDEGKSMSAKHTYLSLYSDQANMVWNKIVAALFIQKFLLLVRLKTPISFIQNSASNAV
jgi:hypothetical protein